MSEDDKDERFYRDTEASRSPKLDDWQLALLEPLGHRRIAAQRGDWSSKRASVISGSAF